MANRCRNNGNSAPKITADSDCILEAEKRLLLGRKAMNNIDCILKSRDITLPAKVHLVKAEVFSSSHVWTIKRAGNGRTDAFELWY